MPLCCFEAAGRQRRRALQLQRNSGVNSGASACPARARSTKLGQRPGARGTKAWPFLQAIAEWVLPDGVGFT